jgi:hypothetical protein
MFAWFFVWGPWWFVLGFLAVFFFAALIRTLAAGPQKECPDCKSTIPANAIKCMHCATTMWPEPPMFDEDEESQIEQTQSKLLYPPYPEGPLTSSIGPPTIRQFR